MKLTLLNQFIGISPMNGHEKTDSGIFVPVNLSKLKTEHGIVKHVGEECSSRIKEGDEVIYDKNYCVEINVGVKEMEKIYIIKEKDIYAYIRRNKNEGVLTD